MDLLYVYKISHDKTDDPESLFLLSFHVAVMLKFSFVLNFLVLLSYFLALNLAMYLKAIEDLNIAYQKTTEMSQIAVY